MTTFNINTKTPEHYPRIKMPDSPKTPISMTLSSPEPMKADMPNAIRKRLIVSGNVQEAGYRVQVKSIARHLGLVGFARNLPDETVEIVCEGALRTIAQFLKAIDIKGNPESPLDINVESIQETPVLSDGEFKMFKIEYNGTMTPEEREQNREIREERMIVGASILGKKMDGVGKAVDDVGKSVDCVGKDVQSVGSAVRDMHSDMNKRFDHMAQRYDLIATSLVKAIDRMDRNSKQTDKAIEQSRKEAAASNWELAKAVNFMIRKLSDKPARKRTAGKRKR
jgi:acylphosphatase